MSITDTISQVAASNPMVGAAVAASQTSSALLSGLQSGDPATSSLLGALGKPTPSMLVSGYHVAFLAAAIMLAAGAVILAVALRRRHLRAFEQELVPAPGVM